LLKNHALINHVWNNFGWKIHICSQNISREKSYYFQTFIPDFGYPKSEMATDTWILSVIVHKCNSCIIDENNKVFTCTLVRDYNLNVSLTPTHTYILKHILCYSCHFTEITQISYVSHFVCWTNQLCIVTILDVDVNNIKRVVRDINVKSWHCGNCSVNLNLRIHTIKCP
jgi:hypothetical protein